MRPSLALSALLFSGLLLSSAGALAQASTSATNSPAQQAAPNVSRAVFQVSDDSPQKWQLVMNNVRNAQADFGPDPVEVEIVVFGPGIGMLKSDSPVAAQIADTVHAGVKVMACENTMKALKLRPADMLPTIGYVPSGVGELIKKQTAGYAYIRP